MSENERWPVITQTTELEYLYSMGERERERKNRERERVYSCIISQHIYVYTQVLTELPYMLNADNTHVCRLLWSTGFFHLSVINTTHAHTNTHKHTHTHTHTLAHLVQGHVGHPQTSPPVHGETVWQVEHPTTPNAPQYSVTGESQQSGCGNRPFRRVHKYITACEGTAEGQLGVLPN